MHPLTAALIISDSQLRADLSVALADQPVRIVFESSVLEPAQLNRFNLDVVFLDAQPPNETIEAALARIRSVAPSCMVAGVSGSADPNAVLNALRAGAHEIILPPIADTVHAAVSRIATMITRRDPQRTARTVGFLSAKGGCGATTFACHIAASLNRKTNHDILLADLDFNSGLTGFLLKTTGQYTIVDAAMNAHRLDASLWKGYTSTYKPRLDVMPSPIAISYPEDFRPEKVRQAMRLATGYYGWIIADLGRGLSPYSAEVLSDLDEICLVTTPSITSLYQAKQVVDRTAERGVPRERFRLIVNQVEQQRLLDRSEIEKVLRVPIFAEVPVRDGLDEAYADGHLMSPESQLGREFERIAAKLAGVDEPDQPSKGWSLLFGRRNAPATAG
jgi:pilus assembly protein CpaE